MGGQKQNSNGGRTYLQTELGFTCNLHSDRLDVVDLKNSDKMATTLLQQALTSVHITINAVAPVPAEDHVR